MSVGGCSNLHILILAHSDGDHPPYHKLKILKFDSQNKYKLRLAQLSVLELNHELMKYENFRGWEHEKFS